MKTANFSNNTMTKFLVSTAAVATLLLLVSCQKNESAYRFTALINSTKTAINASSGKVSWEATDEIIITDAGGVKSEFRIESIDGTASKAEFVKKDGQPDLGAGPYSATYGLAPAADQTYSETVGKFYMTAPATDGTDLVFTVHCGLLKVNLARKGEDVKSIAVTGIPADSGEKTTFTLSCESAQSISEGKDFFIALPEGKYSVIDITTGSGAECSLDISDTDVNINAVTPVTADSGNLMFAVQLWKDGPYWATTNIGAETPVDAGYYFAWGYQDGLIYDSSKNAWVLASDGTTEKKFNTTDFPNRDGGDIASAIWGSGWRMPSYSEFEAMHRNCIVYFIKEEGSRGVRITGKDGAYKDHSLFLPATGYGSSFSWLSQDEEGYYWSGTEASSVNVNCLFFNVTFEEFLDPDPNVERFMFYGMKYFGYPVRAVRAGL